MRSLVEQETRKDYSVVFLLKVSTESPPLAVRRFFQYCTFCTRVRLQRLQKSSGSRPSRDEKMTETTEQLPPSSSAPSAHEVAGGVRNRQDLFSRLIFLECQLSLLLFFLWKDRPKEKEDNRAVPLQSQCSISAGGR